MVNLFLLLEEILKKNVDFRIEVFISRMTDANKLREGKSLIDKLK